MQISISNVIRARNSGDQVSSIVNSFRERVLADSGIFEAESCLNNTLTKLNNT